MMTTTTTTRTRKTNPTRDRRAHRRGERGIALILVLWTFAAIAVLAAEFARAMHDEAASTSNFKESTRARLIAIAGLNEAILAMKVDREKSDSSIEATDEDLENSDPVRSLSHADGQWVKAEFRGQPYEVRVFDEGGKIGINFVDAAQLRVILGNLNLEEDVMETIADSIIDWRDADDFHQPNGAETEYYEDLDRPYRAKNANLDSIEELLLVRGVTREIFYGLDGTPGLRELFSVFSQNAKVNLKTMPPDVIQALAGMDPQAAADYVASIHGADGGATLDELDAVMKAAGISTNRNSKAPQEITVEARVYDASGSAVLAHVGAVMHLSSGGEELKLYRWYDSIFDDPDQTSSAPAQDTAS